MDIPKNDNGFSERVIAVAGPTASGKTRLAVELAKALGGEVISCDSVAVYRGLDVGSAKPTEEEMQGIPHHLIDVAEPTESFSCADYVALASAAADGILSRGKIPVICGGTGLYMDNLILGTGFSPAPADPEFRRRAETVGSGELYRELERIDPDAAAATHPNNRPRVIRALEIFHTTGVTKTEWDRRSRLAPPRYRAEWIGLKCSDRALAAEMIDRRVDRMLADGLEEEVRTLWETGRLLPGTQAAAAIGYAEMLSRVIGGEELEAVREAICVETRHYAKRQMTWFARNRSIRWFEVDAAARGEENFNNIVKKVLNLLTNREQCDII